MIKCESIGYCNLFYKQTTRLWMFAYFQKELHDIFIRKENPKVTRVQCILVLRFPFSICFTFIHPSLSELCATLLQKKCTRIQKLKKNIFILLVFENKSLKINSKWNVSFVVKPQFISYFSKWNPILRNILFTEFFV